MDNNVDIIRQIGKIDILDKMDILDKIDELNEFDKLLIYRSAMQRCSP